MNPRGGNTSLDGVIPVLLGSFASDDCLLEGDVARQVGAMRGFGLSAVALPMFATEVYKLEDEERQRMVEEALSAADGRIGVVANVPYPAATSACRWAQCFEGLGASAIAFPLPRAMGCGEAALLDFARRICDSVSCDVLVQDWNPGGPTIDAEFCLKLSGWCENFRRVKLEEPLSLAKIGRIHEATGGKVRCLEGWGALRAMQALEAGVSGLMPGPAMADVLHRMMCEYQSGNPEAAHSLHELCLPQMVMALQGGVELFVIFEKYMAWKRGMISSRHLRRPAAGVDPEFLRFGEETCERLLRKMEKLGFPSQALPESAAEQV